MFEMENRGELVEKIEDLVNRKRYTELRDLLLPMEPADIAILADDLDDEKTLPLLFRLLPKEQAAEVFVELESDWTIRLTSWRKCPPMWSSGF